MLHGDGLTIGGVKAPDIEDVIILGDAKDARIQLAGLAANLGEDLGAGLGVTLVNGLAEARECVEVTLDTIAHHEDAFSLDAFEQAFAHKCFHGIAHGQPVDAVHL